MKVYKKWIGAVGRLDPGPACRLQTPQFTAAIIAATVKYTNMGEGATCAQNVSLGGTFALMDFTFGVDPSQYAVVVDDIAQERVVLRVERPSGAPQEVAMRLDQNVWKVDGQLTLGALHNRRMPRRLG